MHPAWTPASRVALLALVAGASAIAPVRAQTSPVSGYRSIDGSGNNLDQPDWGRASLPLRRMMPCAYEDSSSAAVVTGLPSARAVSNAVCAQSASMPEPRGLSSYFWQWGQFLDHDLSLTPVQQPREAFPIPVPVGDPHFDPSWSGDKTIPLSRSKYEMIGGIREQMNVLTAWLDGSQIYGSDETRALALRALDGSGRLATSAGGLPPPNTAGLPNDPTPHDPRFFLTGDVRANEQLGLLAIHTLWVREHNYWADQFRAANPQLDDEGIYQMARAWVIAELQAITYREFLPRLLGRSALPAYAGYRPYYDPVVENAFSAAAYRFGHSMLPPELLRVDANYAPIPQGHLRLRDAFFVPERVTEGGGIEPVLRGLALQPSQTFDHLVVDEVRNFLFGPPGSGGFDLPALNMQRGRDHGLPRYNEARRMIGLSPRASFAEITGDAERAARLASVYDSVEDVDLWIGGLSEDPHLGGLVGETFHVILRDQFERLRDGDRFWYQRAFSPGQLKKIERETLARVIRRNTTIGDELPDDVFLLPGGVVDVAPPVLRRLALAGPRPNPVAPGGRVELTVSGDATARTWVAVFDARGRRVAMLHDGPLPEGVRRLAWDGRDERGGRVPPGLYFARARAGADDAVRKVVLLGG